MQPSKPKKKFKLDRLTVELVAMTVLFLGLVIGVQAMQGDASKPQYNPLAMVWGTAQMIMTLRGQ